eukprot:4672732-Ditylum_brightwellii.AAC.1
MSTMLANVLRTMGNDDKDIKIAVSVIGTMQRIMLINKETLLLNSDLKPGMIDKIMCLKEWYVGFREKGGTDNQIADKFTDKTWTQFLIDKFKAEKEVVTKEEEESNDEDDNKDDIEEEEEDDVINASTSSKVKFMAKAK